MIYGIGTDLVENDRIRGVIQRWGNKFINRVFSEEEIKYCNRHADRYVHFGARFAIKESFLKAAGVGLGRGIKLIEIQVLNEESGKPCLFLTGGARQFYEKAEIQRSHITITHTKKYAAAVVILEK
jgi:holo-[acyl-carrier protein] synthase